MLEFGFSYLYFISQLLSQSNVLWWLTCDTVWLYPSFLTSTITFPCFHVASLLNSTVNAALDLTIFSIESGMISYERKQSMFSRNNSRLEKMNQLKLDESRYAFFWYDVSKHICIERHRLKCQKNDLLISLLLQLKTDTPC